MQMNDTQRVPASREKVWAGLNDPEILRKCIPGCQSLDMTSPTEMTANVAFTGPTLTTTFAVISVGEVISRLWQPGMHLRRISGLLRPAQTFSRDAGTR